MATYIPAPAPGAPSEVWTRFHESRQLRLELGDEAYVGWLAAKLAFISEVKAACVATWPPNVDVLGNMDPLDPDTDRFDFLVGTCPIEPDYV